MRECEKRGDAWPPGVKEALAQSSWFETAPDRERDIIHFGFLDGKKFLDSSQSIARSRRGLQRIVSYLNRIISYHIISYHIISYHIISYHIESYRMNRTVGAGAASYCCKAATAAWSAQPRNPCSGLYLYRAADQSRSCFLSLSFAKGPRQMVPHAQR